MLASVATVDRKLDEALEMTFPASDPLAVYVPTPAAPAQALPGGSASAGRDGARMRILIIDDEEPLRLLIRRILETSEHQAVEASDGRAGLAAFQAQPFDAVVTDIVMPGTEGVETIMELRKLDKNVRIVAISGGGILKNLDILKLARSLGANATLRKPFTADELLACVEGRSSGRDQDGD
jgi:CheY-like chemotaxis protein